MKQLRICSSLSLHPHPKDSISDYIRSGLLFHKETGFDAADLDMDMRLLRYHEGDLTPYMEQALADAEQIGIKFELCHLPFSGGNTTKEDQQALFSARVHRAIDAASQIGVRYAVLHPNTTTIPMRSFCQKEQYDLVMSHLASFVEHAEKVGVNVVIENMRLVSGPTLSHRYCQTPEELCEIADALGIGVCWDFGHAHISGLKQSEALSYVGKRLKVLHVNDNFGVDDEHLAPFMGTIDWKDAMHGLALAEFDGLFNYEVSAARIPAALRDTYAQYLMNASQELLSYIE